MEARIGRRFTLVIPAPIRKAVNLKVGDTVIVDQDVRGNIVLVPKPKNFTQVLKELGTEAFGGVDPIEYQRKEREQWPD
ncbi:MAG: AbrB/MazE/SpoVT family DNA-binding domain-containing protein [Symbiobacteriia bacterium]